MKYLLIEEFTHKYTSIPFATVSRKHRKHTVANNIDTLFHIHKEVELLLVLSGKAKLFVEENTLDIKCGDLVLIPPYAMHRYTIFSDYDFEHYCMCFDLDLLYDKTLKNELENGTVTFKNVVESNEKYAVLVKEAFESDATRKDGWELKVIGNISLLFSALKEDKFILAKNTNDKKPICHKIIDYINKNYTNDITSSDIAKELFLNHSYFCRMFRDNFGHCFQNDLCMYRIQKSKSYLKNTDMDVSEIASLVGFNSFSYYSKKFKEYTCLKPSEYRNNEK